MQIAFVLLVMGLLFYSSCEKSTCSEKNDALVDKEHKAQQRADSLQHIIDAHRAKLKADSLLNAEEARAAKTQLINSEKYGFIETGGVGKFIIGGSIPIYRAEGPLRIVKETRMVHVGEGFTEEEPYYMLKEGDELILEATAQADLDSGYDDTTIRDIMPRSSKIKTKKGIGLKSSINDFLQAYPNAKLKFIYEGEYTFQLTTDELPSVYFYIDDDAYTKALNIVDDSSFYLPTEGLNKSAPIINIRVE